MVATVAADVPLGAGVRDDEPISLES